MPDVVVKTVQFVDGLLLHRLDPSADCIGVCARPDERDGKPQRDARGYDQQ
jgi:hypothetical protein